jgi:hypothetical protein
MDLATVPRLRSGKKRRCSARDDRKGEEEWAVAWLRASMAMMRATLPRSLRWGQQRALASGRDERRNQEAGLKDQRYMEECGEKAAEC